MGEHEKQIYTDGPVEKFHTEKYALAPSRNRGGRNTSTGVIESTCRDGGSGLVSPTAPFLVCMGTHSCGIEYLLTQNKQFLFEHEHHNLLLGGR